MVGLASKLSFCFVSVALDREGSLHLVPTLDSLPPCGLVGQEVPLSFSLDSSKIRSIS